MSAFKSAPVETAANRFLSTYLEKNLLFFCKKKTSEICRIRINSSEMMSAKLGYQWVMDDIETGTSTGSNN